MRHGNAGIGRRGNTRGNARHDLEWNIRFGEGLRLLAATPEDKGIATLEPDNALPLACEPNEQPVDLFLSRRVAAAAPLADVVPLGRAIGEQYRVGQCIVDDGVAPGDQLTSAYCDQTGITRPGTHEKHAAGRGLRVRRHVSAACAMGTSLAQRCGRAHVGSATRARDCN
jgi:hypothetical protein